MLNGFIAGLTSVSLLFGAVSTSPTYQLQNYGLGSGGTNNSSSGSYRLNGNSGEVGSTSTTGGTTKTGSGSTETRQANVPLAPTLSNSSGQFYNKLSFVINRTNPDPADYEYSIAVSTNDFVNTSYVQADGTLGTAAVYQTYSAWGGAAGSVIIGLTSSTTYKVKMNARQGAFTESAYGPAATQATASPALSFSVSPTIVGLGDLLAGTVVTGGDPISFAFSTNGASGGSVYVAGSNGGLRSPAVNTTIASQTADLGSQSTGIGLIGSTTNATFGSIGYNSPYNGSGNNVGQVMGSFKQLFSGSSVITGGTANLLVKAKASTTTPSAADYSETLTFVASASF